ncbi:hypothetical protein [Vibrio owensii]|uniref:hypothetical protein n=1 Tax=Vibrio owensii TaxID=696485 RepID=UPI003CC67D72
MKVLAITALAVSFLSTSAFANVSDFNSLKPAEQFHSYKEMSNDEKDAIKIKLHSLATSNPELTRQVEATLINIMTVDNEQLRNAYWSNQLGYEGTVVHQRNELINTDRVNVIGTSKDNKPYINRHALLEGIAPIGLDGKPVEVCRLIQTKSAAYFEMSFSDVQDFLNDSKSPMSKEESCLTKNLSSNYWKARYSTLIDKDGDYIK